MGSSMAHHGRAQLNTLYYGGNMLSWPVKALRTVSILYVGYSALALLWTLCTSLRGFVDFPCYASIDQEGCLWLDYYYEPTPANSEMRLYLTAYEAGFSGAGCWAESSRTGRLNVAGHLFQRDNEDLVIDRGPVVRTNERWESTRVLSWWNPWRVVLEKTSLTNHGVVTCFRDPRTRQHLTRDPTLVVIGDTGTHYVLNWRGIVLLQVFGILLSWTYAWQERVSR